MKSILSLFVAGMMCMVLAYANTIHVPQNYPTIQSAISAAVAGDSILIDPGTYDGFYVTSGPSNLTILGAGSFCDNPTILHKGPTNPYHECIRIMNVSGWEVGQMTLRQIDPTGGSTFDLHFSNNCRIHHVDFAEVAPEQGNGFVINGCTNILVERCLIRAGNYDVLTCWYTQNNNITFRNLTISGNSHGIINRAPVPGWHIYNCLTYANNGPGFEIYSYQPSYLIQYNDSWGNNGSNYTGFNPDPTNLSVNPLLVGGTGWWAYMPTANSPLIDAGDPNSPLDPDGTRADIGCFWYYQGPGGGHVTLDLAPVNPPIIIPAQGGNFSYTATLTCDTSGWAVVDAWASLRQPDGQIMGPLFIRPNIHFNAGQSLFRLLQMYVSSWAMPGTYWFRVYLGNSSTWTVMSADSFSFVKQPISGYTPPGQNAYLTITGWDDPVRVDLPTASALPQEMALTASPNPFNPTTAISYQLSTNSHVSLRVYDTAGRMVTTLVDGWREAGTNEITFDGSKLASGIYLAVLEAGGQRLTQRLLLMK